MTDERIKQLRALCEAATPAPWHGGNQTVGADEMRGIWEWSSSGEGRETNRADARFIAAARTALPEALDEIERLRNFDRGTALGDALLDLNEAVDQRDRALAEAEQFRRELKMARPPGSKFCVGDRVRKVKGYTFDGTVVSVFRTVAGKVRIVVDNDTSPGMLHIFNEEQCESKEEAP